SPYRVEFFNELGKYCDLTVLFERRTASNREKDWISDNVKNFKAVFLKGINFGEDSAICFSVRKWLRKNMFDIFVVVGYSTPTVMIAIETLNLRKIPFFINSDGGFIRDDKKTVGDIKRHFISSATWWLSSGRETNKYLKYYGAIEKNIFRYSF